MYSIRMTYTEGIFYNGSFGVRCDIHSTVTGEHLSYGWGGDKLEALFFAEDTMLRNLGLPTLTPDERESRYGRP